MHPDRLMFERHPDQITLEFAHTELTNFFNFFCSVIKLATLMPDCLFSGLVSSPATMGLKQIRVKKCGNFASDPNHLVFRNEAKKPHLFYNHRVVRCVRNTTLRTGIRMQNSDKALTVRAKNLTMATIKKRYLTEKGNYI